MADDNITSIFSRGPRFSEADLAIIENDLSERLGVSVKLEARGEGVAINLWAPSIEQLDAICGLLMAKA